MCALPYCIYLSSARRNVYIQRTLPPHLFFISLSLDITHIYHYSTRKYMFLHRANTLDGPYDGLLLVSLGTSWDARWIYIRRSRASHLVLHPLLHRSEWTIFFLSSPSSFMTFPTVIGRSQLFYFSASRPPITVRLAYCVEMFRYCMRLCASPCYDWGLPYPEQFQPQLVA